MKELIVRLKTISTPTATIGYLSAGGLFECFTLELPWLDNARNISCISAGDYDVVRHVSPSKGECFKILDVPGRTDVLIHVGNFTRNSNGCILVGKEIVKLNSDLIPDVSESTATLSKMLSQLPSKFTLEIMRL